MTKADAGDSAGEEEDEKYADNEEEEEFFYESQDRILSSSNSSTSASEDEGAGFTSPSHSQSSHYLGRSTSKSSPKFPIRLRNYDAWISDAAFSSASLQQRRDRLLNALGLSSDPTLSRRNSSVSENGCDLARSVSSVLLSADGRSSRVHPDSGIIPSECEGFTCNKCEPSHRRASVDHRCCSQCDTTSPSTKNRSICSFSDNTVNTNSINKNNYNSVHVDDLDVDADNLPRKGLACLNQPSSRKGGSRDAEIQSDIARSDPGDLSRDRRGNCEENVDGDGARDGSDEKCTIKNLDTGKEFVVNEVRDDGTWKKLKEVGTGRQLTMEEFEMCVGHSPIVQELMRRQNVEEQAKESYVKANGNGDDGGKSRKRVSWFKSIKNVASSVTGRKERRSSDERDTSSEKGAQRSISAADDGQDISFHGPERIRSRQYGKSAKELTALYKSQEIKAHNGSIWCIKFSLDGRYLATAGEDCVIHVWQVIESERKGELLRSRPDDSSLSLLRLSSGFPDLDSLPPNLENPLERKRQGRTSIGRKSMSLDRIVVPETVFGLSEKPICSFHGHHDDVLDLSWSKSQLLLSSSMDKTVRLWSLSSRTCLKIFTHSDYVTCIQFNPVDDRYFISGSLDSKVRIWSIPDRQVVDWNDLHEMVTAACYTPDGQGALVGSYKGNCRLYDTSENKLLPKSQINLQNKKKKAHLKKITGFQFAPGSSSEVLITSADSRVRVVDGIDLVHKFKGFRNSNSQISASITSSGKYVVSASEDSQVYIWKHGGGTGPGESKGISVTRSYEHFHCQDVSTAIPWPGFSDSCELNDPRRHLLDDTWTNSHPPPTTPTEEFNGTPSATACSSNSPFCSSVSSATNSYFFDRFSATWPEEKLLLAARGQSPRPSLDLSKGNRSAWGLVIVTAGLQGEIRTFQNFGLPARV